MSVLEFPLKERRIMSSATGKKEDKEQHIRTSRTADAGSTNIADAIIDMNGSDDQNKCS